MKILSRLYTVLVYLYYSTRTNIHAQESFFDTYYLSKLITPSGLALDNHNNLADNVHIYIEKEDASAKG